MAYNKQTASKRAERARVHKQEAEALNEQAALLNLAHDSIIVFDTKGKITFWSDGAQETYGWRREEAVGRVIHDLLKTRFPKPLAELNRETAKKGRWEGELGHTRKDGREIVVISRWAVRRNGEGKQTDVLEINRDITERKRIEEALRTSESTLRSFYESAPLMMGVVEVTADNSDIIHLYDNPETDKFFGRPLGSTVGQSALKMGVPEEAVRRWIENYRQSEREGRRVQFEYWHPQKGGAVWLSAVVARIGPGRGGRTRFSYAVADVTERKRVEETLRASEERLTLATLGGELGVWDWDLARDTAQLSGKYYEISGYREGEVEPNREFFRRQVHPEDLAMVEGRVAAHLRGESDYLVVEYRMRRKTGEYRWIRGVGKIVARDKEGGPLRMAGVIADITAQKKAEEGLREQLAHASRVSTLGELASSIAHELGQPIAATVCNVDAAELSLNRAPPAVEEVRDVLTDIRKDNQRADDVIERMRKLLLKHEVEREPVELNLLAEEVLELVKEDAASRKIKIRTELSPQLPVVRGNRVQLQQVVLNFIMNAMDAVGQQPPERRRLTVSTGAGTDGVVQLLVSDLGPGIEPANLPRLFQPFFTTKASGLGIGLSVAERIVTALGGRVWAENRPSGGAIFHMALPTAEGRAQREMGPHAKSAKGRKEVHVRI
jgi:PAS domain S-box-containing protein